MACTAIVVSPIVAGGAAAISGKIIAMKILNLLAAGLKSTHLISATCTTSLNAAFSGAVGATVGGAIAGVTAEIVVPHVDNVKR